MNQHINRFLPAYIDGELQGDRLNQVEAHLGECLDCRQELEALRALSEIVQEYPASPATIPADRFTNQVLEQLDLDPEEPAWNRVLKTGWRLAPVGLLAGWAFVQAVLVGGALAGLLWVTGFIPGGWTSSLALGFLDLLLEIPPFLGVGTTLASLGALSTLATTTLAVLIWAWLASWWAYRRHRVAEA